MFGLAMDRYTVAWDVRCHPAGQRTLGDVDSPQALAGYQAAKRIHKQEWADRSGKA